METKIIGIRENKYIEDGKQKTYHVIYCKDKDCKFKIIIKFKDLRDSNEVKTYCIIKIKSIIKFDEPLTHIPKNDYSLLFPLKRFYFYESDNLDKFIYFLESNFFDNKLEYNSFNYLYKLKMYENKKLVGKELCISNEKFLSYTNNEILEIDKKDILCYECSKNNIKNEYSINLNIFKTTPRYKEHRLVFIFTGNSEQSKNFISTNSKLKSYYVDYELPDNISSDIIVMNDKFTIEQIKEKIIKPAYIIIGEFLDDDKLDFKDFDKEPLPFKTKQILDMMSKFV